MVRIGNTTVYWAYFSALGFFKPTNSFSALFGVNDVDCFPFLDSFVLAFWFASATTDAIVGDLVCHFLDLTSFTLLI